MGRFGCSGNNHELVLLAALTATQLAQGLTEDQMGTLSAFFSALGDNLAILSTPLLCHHSNKTGTEG